MIEITAEWVRQFVHSQFPQWRDLEVAPVEKSGHDNRTYRLGNELTVRLPSHERYASAIKKESIWLPVFQPLLSWPIPIPVALGAPTEEYPLPWSVNRWIEGDTVTHANILDSHRFAEDLAGFLNELQAIDANGGIPAGEQNFHRGGNLAVYDPETRAVIERLPSSYDQKLLTEIWELALATSYHDAPVWLHGDVAVGNLLVKDGRLCGVIDFGTMGVGDPSSDLVMAWNFFDDASRQLFLNLMSADQDTVNRARGWALWKALITYAWNEPASEASNWGKHVIDVIMREYNSL
ncbi:Predicted kinase, aminoglycoside phosphotransferase (APT) family [Paenibacillus sp. UNCCL117]|uniref:aminoglycoside phosphotransferase family protein n=1 Tax=unclassified Paenibacillus TaxID=185978 RepID=UPI000885EB73|nr:MULTISPECIES: aminoglycoside phosphotransferase family protein [unclassified Paenibacillus]SDE12593.1 Predicted kinase, aminoglycoside phosphotransferase (APT) family [Paenibacillus sp. cl123]SFW60215.1 Predicted kinase, aminoglycoside phosphotransferase (APT) family [Paenibacillus sp. UNCCL117]